MTTKNTLRYILSAFILTIIISGCDPFTDIEYRIINRSDKPLNVYYSFEFNDSVYEAPISPGLDTVFFTSGYRGTGQDFTFQEDFIESLFDSLHVEPEDKSPVLKDINNSSEWIFQKKMTGRLGFTAVYKAVYVFVLEQEDF